MNDPERLDRDSASSAYRRRRCVGSSNLIRALRKESKLPPEEPDPDAQSGTRIHAAWCGQPADLSVAETETLTNLCRLERMVLCEWAGKEECVLLGREQRLWLHEHLEPVHSGQFDVAYGTLTSRRMLIMDGKTGRKTVAPAIQNDQLRELVALARANFPLCSEFSVAILQPWVSERVSIAVYDQPEAELALRELKRTLSDSADPEAPRIPGVWCDNCPAQTVCAEARANANHAYELAKRIEAGEFELPTGPRGTRLLDAISAATSALEAVRKRYKALLAKEPDAVPGWYLKEPKRVRSLPDALGAYGIAKDFMTLDEFFNVTTTGVTALEAACAKASGLRGKGLSEWFNDRFGPQLVYKEQAPELASEAEAPRKKERKALP